MTLLQTTTESLVFGVITSEKLWELGIGALVTIISILGSAYLAYRYALKRFKKETPLLLQRDLYNKKIKVLQDLWKLLQYTTEDENPKSILHYKVVNKETKEREWYFIMENGKVFRKKIIGFFYGKGAGLFLSKELKALLFEYDRHVYSFLLREKDNPNNTHKKQSFARKNDTNTPRTNYTAERRNTSA